MKNIKLFSLLLLACGLILTSCGDDDVEIFPPTLSISADTVYAFPGSDAMIAFTASPSTNSQFTDLIVTDAFANYSDTVSYAGATTIDAPYAFTVPAAAQIDDIYIVTLVMGDNTGASASDQVVVRVNGTSFPTTQNGEMWHRFGPSPGAYDLINDVARVNSDPNEQKDMENLSNAGEAFNPGFQALNNTLFFLVQDDPEFWNNANTTEAVIEKCESVEGGSVTTFPNPAEGDIVIVQLRDGSHAVMLIGAIDPMADPTGSAGNLGKIDFQYKKPS